MQDTNALSGTFLHRTDALAARLSVNVQDLPERIGISRRTLFAGRKNNAVVTSKTWLKLAKAEREAEIRTASNEASREVMRRLARDAESKGKTNEEKQAFFEESLDREYMPTVEEILHLRDEVKRLRAIIEKAREVLGEED